MIYILLPSYNEEKNIKILISKLEKLMARKDYKIIAVNDGSADRTLHVLKNIKSSRLVIVSYYINMNIGTAFSVGIDRILSESKNDNDIMIIMESDQTSEVELVNDLIFQIKEKNNDIVIASRYKKGGKYINFPFTRKIFSCGANWLMRILFPVNDIRDYTIFFRAYRMSLLKTAVMYFSRFGLIQSKGFGANVELLIKMSQFTCRISGIPFKYDYAKKIGKTKIKIISTISEYIVLVNYLKRIFRKVKKWDKIKREPL